MTRRSLVARLLHSFRDGRGKLFGPSAVERQPPAKKALRMPIVRTCELLQIRKRYPFELKHYSGLLQGRLPKLSCIQMQQ